MYIECDIEGVVQLQVTDDLKATVTNDGEMLPVVQLESKEEADKLKAELEDLDGELPAEKDSICNKYPALRVMIP